MLRLLLLCLTLLILLYALKVMLVQLAVPVESPLAEDERGDDAADSDREALGNSSTLQAGAIAFRKGEDAKAWTHLRHCIEHEEDSSMRAACKAAHGELVLLGAGGPRNLSAATELFLEAAEAGDPDAQYTLGILYAAMYVPDEDLQRREALAVLHLYAASTAGHPGALMAMGYRHLHGYGVPQACTTAALNYIDVAKRIASVYSEGMPQAVELIRLNLHQKDRKVISSSEMNLFVQIATSGDTTVAAAIGKRYLLGIEGFKQDYRKAKHYLRLAASRNHPGALALLGYMHSLGLGTSQNYDTAYSYFVSAASQNDPLGHNGLGFMYFRGTNAQARNLRLAFKHFNESAFGGSSDGMFNLASMYLTGTGTEQSFQKAVLFYTQALDRGHTPAAYSLAVMHLNGIGTARDCDIAVNLLKKVCERGEWVSSKLVEAYEYGEKVPDRAALLFLKLAEAGHEVAQMNAAHLFDSGQSSLLYPGNQAMGQDQTAEVRHHSRTLAQRYYEMSAEQGSASSELRLGDYSYYGWGVSATFKDQYRGSSEGDAQDSEEEGLPAMYTTNEVEINPQSVDFEASLARYRKTADMTVTGEWMQTFVARGSFNLGYMHQFGLGVAQDLHIAKQHYHRCREVDPSGLHTPVTMVLVLLGLHMIFLRCPTKRKLFERLFADARVHILIVHLVGILSLVLMRCHFSRRRPSGQSPPASPQGARPAVRGPSDNLLVH
mmetsp:Transcript_77753/g.172166  ORF Transcript_77753/g.172166 Transcript_77753/m.172166 type:complete len:720 (-) Transcript_77753:49-2208(-)